MKHVLTSTLLSLLMLPAARPASGQESVLVEVTAGDTELAGVPVSVMLPESIARSKGLYMQRLDTGQEIIGQLSGEELTWIVADRLPPGLSRRYRIIGRRTATSVPQEVTCQPTERTLEMLIGRGRRSVLTYHTSVLLPPRDLDPVFARSGFIHPLRTPAGQVVTADFPADHAHQHGIFFAWKQAVFEGRPIDFWNQADRTGNVEHVSVDQLQSGPVFAEFTATLRHVDLTASEGVKPVLNEQWVVRVYNHQNVSVVDLTSRQQCASESPLTLVEYHYGGMGYRGPTEWLESEAGCQMTTSEGIGRKEGNHTRPRWVDVTGTIAGRPCGLRAIGHPDNFRAPQPVRLHPSKPYFVFAPEVLGEFAIKPGEVYESRYRFLAFDGSPSARVDQLASGYASPPTVRIVE